MPADDTVFHGQPGRSGPCRGAAPGGGAGGDPDRNGIWAGGRRGERARRSADLRGQGPSDGQSPDRAYCRLGHAAAAGGGDPGYRRKAGPGILARAADHDFSEGAAHSGRGECRPAHRCGADAVPSGGPGGHPGIGPVPRRPVGQPLRLAQPDHRRPCAGRPGWAHCRGRGRRGVLRGCGIHRRAADGRPCPAPASGRSDARHARAGGGACGG